MKENWLYTYGGGGCGKFTRAKKRSANSEDLNTLFAYAMAKDLKIKKSIKLKLKMTTTRKLSLKILTSKH